MGAQIKGEKKEINTDPGNVDAMNLFKQVLEMTGENEK